MYFVFLDLCTYVETGKSYRHQEWFYCHNCSFEVNEGICTVCLKTCHAGHDVKPAKYGLFFCDCGAKGEQYCHGLVKKKSGMYQLKKFFNSSNPICTFLGIAISKIQCMLFFLNQAKI